MSCLFSPFGPPYNRGRAIIFFFTHGVSGLVRKGQSTQSGCMLFLPPSFPLFPRGSDINHGDYATAAAAATAAASLLIFTDRSGLVWSRSVWSALGFVFVC